jgi:hypothetical protein
MPFVPNDFHAWNRQTIINDTPAASGVYGIFREGLWIYVGESADMQSRLVQHLTGDDSADIRAQAPIGFTFEQVAAAARMARQRQLIAELNPVCNRNRG